MLRNSSWRTAAAMITAALLVGCGTAGSPGNDGAGSPAGDDAAVIRDSVRYTAHTAVLESFPVQLRTTVTAENVGSSTAVLEFTDGCTVLLRASTDASRTDTVWDQARAVMCTQALQRFELQPGEQREFTTATDAAEILGGTLPDGRYHFTAYLRVNGGRVDVPAGSAELAVRR